MLRLLNQLREQQTGGGGTSYILDTYSMTAGWSLRRLATSPTYGIRVSRSSDSAQTDVELPVSGSINLGSIVSAGGNLGTWAGANSVYITKYYNQGNGGTDFDMVQTIIPGKTATIITTGTLETYLGLTNAKHGNDGYVTASGGMTLEGVSGEISAFWVGKSDISSYILDSSISLIHQIIRNRLSTKNLSLVYNAAAGNIQSFTTVADTYIASILSSIKDTSNLQTWRNLDAGNLIALTGTHPTGKTGEMSMNMRENGTSPIVGNFFEALYDKGDQGSNRVAIVDDINAYYSIY
jgi:hypothetical protein